MVTKDSKLMQPPRKLRILSPTDLSHLTVERLLEYRRKALSLENSLADSDHRETAGDLDESFIWFKDDPRWELVYANILAELDRKQSP